MRAEGWAKPPAGVDEGDEEVEEGAERSSLAQPVMDVVMATSDIKANAERYLQAFFQVRTGEGGHRVLGAPTCSIFGRRTIRALTILPHALSQPGPTYSCTQKAASSATVLWSSCQ
jgi:hypothetical protein